MTVTSHLAVIQATIVNFDTSSINNTGAKTGDVSGGNGGVYTFTGSDASGSLTASEPSLEYGPDQFGRVNAGSYSAAAVSSAQVGQVAGGLDVDASVFGNASPLVAVSADQETRFVAGSDGFGAVEFVFKGSVQSGAKDQIGLQLDRIDPITEGVLDRAVFLPRDVGTGSTGASGNVEFDLVAGGTYRLNANAFGSALGSDTRGSEIEYAIRQTQSLEGNSESNPLKPYAVSLSKLQGFGFLLESTAAVDGTVWLDPEVAIGFDYDILGALVESVTAPSLMSVNDPDGYELLYGGQSFALAAGQTHVPAAPISGFTIMGIDPLLGLDPDNPGGFTLGLDFTDAVGNTILVKQEPLTTTVASAVPLPASVLMLLSGVAGLMAMGRGGAGIGGRRARLGHPPGRWG